MKWILPITLIGAVFGAQQVTLTDPDSLGRAVTAAVDVLASHYKADWDIDTGDSQISWFHRGIFHGTLLDYRRVTGDPMHDARASRSLGIAANGKTADILGGSLRSIQEKVYGKWNDDIAWWAISMATGAEIFGRDALMTNSGSYLNVAILTWNQMIEPEQWDENTCNGGFFWSRNRQSDKENQALFKSSITHTQFILLSGKLALLTGNRTYVQWAAKVLNWMKEIDFILPNYHIIDGAYAPDCRRKKDIREFSYIPGTLLGGLAYLYEFTKDQMWMDEASKFLDGVLEQYTVDGVLGEFPCETSSRGCARDEKSFKSQLVKGLGYLHRYTNSQTMKRKIQTVIDDTVKSMLANCDSDWNCPYSWVPNAPLQIDVFNQHSSAQLLITAAMIRPAKVIARKVDTVDSTRQKKKNLGLSFSQNLMWLSFVPGLLMIIA